MKTLLCPLWPRSREGGGWIVRFALLVAMGMLAACVLLPHASFVRAERSGNLDLDAIAGEEPALQTVGPLAPVFVEINARGWAFVSGKRVTPTALRDMLRRTRRILPDQQVVFKVSDSTPTQYLGPYLEACTAAGIRCVQFIGPE